MSSIGMPLFSVVVGAVVLAWATLWVRGRLAGWAGRRRSRRGILAETRAAKSLKQLGFSLLEYQPQLDGVVMVDGRPRRFGVRPDYLVARGGAVYYVEVKSGERNIDPLCLQTRRQLREYADLADVDGLLLFDARNRQLMQVDFPQPFQRAAGRSGAKLGWLAAGLALGWILHELSITL